MSTNMYSDDHLPATRSLPRRRTPSPAEEYLRPLASCPEASIPPLPEPNGEYDHSRWSTPIEVAGNSTQRSIDSGFCPDDEPADPDPDLILNEVEVEETNCEPISWFVGDPFPDFGDLSVPDVLCLCRRFRINPRTGRVLLNFRIDDPLWQIRCEFASFYRNLFAEYGSLLQDLAREV